MLPEDWQIHYRYRWTFSPDVKLPPFFLVERPLDFHLLTGSSFTLDFHFFVKMLLISCLGHQIYLLHVNKR